MSDSRLVHAELDSSNICGCCKDWGHGLINLHGPTYQECKASGQLVEAEEVHICFEQRQKWHHPRSALTLNVPKGVGE